MSEPQDDTRQTITLPSTQWSAIVLALGLVDRQRAWAEDCHAAKNEIIRQREIADCASTAREIGRGR